VIKSDRFSMSAWLQQEAGSTSSAEAKKSEPRGQEKKCCKLHNMNMLSRSTRSCFESQFKPA